MLTGRNKFGWKDSRREGDSTRERFAGKLQEGARRGVVKGRRGAKTGKVTPLTLQRYLPSRERIDDCWKS